MKKESELPVSRGGFTIIHENGLYGLRDDWRSEIILECKLEMIEWKGDYLCLKNQGKWCFKHIDSLRWISNKINELRYR